jgi:hypothetical protein
VVASKRVDVMCSSAVGWSDFQFGRLAQLLLCVPVNHDFSAAGGLQFEPESPIVLDLTCAGISDIIERVEEGI